jgi:rubrerythrin
VPENQPDKPSYLGLLNAIAVAEAEAEVFLHCWADATPRDDVRQVLRTVALREGEHAKAFEKRVCELGFELRPGVPDQDRAAVAASTTLTDREKFEKLGLGGEAGDGPDVFAGMFADTTIDIQTGALLGRYIAEERDSGRMFRACYQALCAEGNGSGPGSDMADVNERLDRIEAALEKLAKPAGRKKK